MGVNRIVMHNGVVWWLPPLRPKTDSADAETPAVEPPAPRRRKRPEAKDRPRRSAGPGAMPPAGFIPLESLGIPGIDSILDSHADFYRDAYDRAVRDQQSGRGQPRGGQAGSPPDDGAPGDPG